jgi:hypothetical protein
LVPTGILLLTSREKVQILYIRYICFQILYIFSHPRLVHL